jgi:drug/metabolite transporter (DMT)-like permease
LTIIRIVGFSATSGNGFLQMERKVNLHILLALTVVLLFWASSFAGIRAGLKAYGPGHLVLLRFIISSAVMAVYALLTRMRMPEKRDFPAILILGLFGMTGYHVPIVFGEVTVTAGAASLLIASGPIFTALLAVLFLGERLRVWGWLGIGVSFFGVFLIARGEGGSLRFEPGALLILFSALSTSLYFVFQKPYLKKYKPIEFTAYSIWGGTFFMLPFLPGLSRSVSRAPLEATLSVAYLGIFPAVVAYVAWIYETGFDCSQFSLPPARSRHPDCMVLAEGGSHPPLRSWGTLAISGVVIVNTRGKERVILRTSGRSL